MAEILTRECEGHTIVTNGSTICPHPTLADQAKGETYEEYVHRHAFDHQLGHFDELEDAERNLSLWCIFYYHKHIQGNMSLGTGDAIVAEWEPCWEDAEYIANWSFAPSDTEHEIEWEKRTFRLKPFAERDHEAAEYRYYKKLTKVRGTQKTSWGKAAVTWNHLRAYFVEGKITFRVLVISASSDLARDHYFEPLKTMWDSHDDILRLFGRDVQRGSCNSPEHVDPDLCRKGNPCTRTRWHREGILTKGSKSGRNTLRLRWNVDSQENSGMAALSLKAAGITSITTGNRWDFVFVDDPVVPENVANDAQRRKVANKIAELRKQKQATGHLLYLNTPYHLDDASSIIDKKFKDEYHIMYRPAFWMDPADPKRVVVYWSYNALPEGDKDRTVWPIERINKERRQPDFWSQVALRLRNDDSALFSEKDFQKIDLADCPPEIRFGLGRSVTDEERAYLESEKLTIRSYMYVDSSGRDEQTKTGCDTAVVNWRIDRAGRLYLVYINGGQLSATEEQEMIFAAWLYGRAELIRYELSGAHMKHVKQSFLDFQERKSIERKRPILLPLLWDPVAPDISKTKRIEHMQPFAVTKRIFIVNEAGPEEKIQRFIDEHTNLGMLSSYDYADAGSMVLKDVEPPSLEEVAAEEAEKTTPIEWTEEDGLTIEKDFLVDLLANTVEPLRNDEVDPRLTRTYSEAEELYAELREGTNG